MSPHHRDLQPLRLRHGHRLGIPRVHVADDAHPRVRGEDAVQAGGFSSILLIPMTRSQGGIGQIDPGAILKDDPILVHMADSLPPFRNSET